MSEPRSSGGAKVSTRVLEKERSAPVQDDMAERVDNCEVGIKTPKKITVYEGGNETATCERVKNA